MSAKMSLKPENVQQQNRNPWLLQFRLAGINGIMGGISVNLPHKSTLIAARNNTKYQIFHYTRCITPKRVTSLRGPPPRHCTYGQHCV